MDLLRAIWKGGGTARKLSGIEVRFGLVLLAVEQTVAVAFVGHRRGHEPGFEQYHLLVVTTEVEGIEAVETANSTDSELETKGS